LFTLAVKQSSAQLIYIPDPAWASFLQTEVPNAMVYADSLNPNDPSVAATTGLFCSSMNIHDLTGLSSFVNLQSFDCSNNHGLTTIPYIANSVTSFEINDCDSLATITNIPTSLTSFGAGSTGLTSLPPFPGGLTHIHFSDNKLTSLPSLPSGLLELTVEGNDLTSLPSLPASLTLLNVTANSLTVLPALPASLTTLFCGYNPSLVVPSLSSSSITSLDISETVSNPFPALPPGLLELSCDGMFPPLTSLPPLPQNLALLSCRHNNLTTLPLLPPNLDWLDCRYNSIMNITQPLPSTCSMIQFTNNPISCIPQLHANGISFFETDMTDCLFNKPPGCNDCLLYSSCSPAYSCNNMAYVSGTVFNDVNTDGTLNNGEPGRKKIYLFSNNGNFSTECDSNGSYYLPADTGISFVVNVQVPPYRVVSTTPVSHYFSNYGNIDSLNHIGIYDIPNINDLAVSLTSYPAIRPGFDYHSLLTMDNPGTTIQNGQVYLVKPSIMTFVSAAPTQSSVSGDTIFWNFSNFQPLGATANFDAVFSVPTSVVAGTVINSYAGIIAAGNDTTPANNFAVDNQTVVNSCDPNDKQAEPAGGLTLSQIAIGEYMTYTVRFQNTGTAPAVNVVIADTLSSTLDLTTFNIVSASHAYTWKIENRVLYLRFENIMLPDSNSNEPQSHGCFKYRVKPYNTLQAGDMISNTAYIYFDFNSAVQTNTTNTLVLPLGIAGFNSSDGPYAVFPNPAHENLMIRFKELQTGAPALISVFDVWGRTVLTTERNQGSEIELNLSSISGGIYFLQVKWNGKVYQNRFVKD
ncbi:MAG TPA: T9SS type A sorting domain-containing protein, partial [Bacteroidia bacterium]|nr:T9SS type A sorting domain-containing protein [Bacteroidia bacterium]